MCSYYFRTFSCFLFRTIAQMIDTQGVCFSEKNNKMKNFYIKRNIWDETLFAIFSMVWCVKPSGNRDSVGFDTFPNYIVSRRGLSLPNRMFTFCRKSICGGEQYTSFYNQLMRILFLGVANTKKIG